MRNRLRRLLYDAVSTTCRKLGQELPADFSPLVEVQENEQFGDFSSNAALILAKALHRNPRELAGHIVEAFDKEDVGNGAALLLDTAEVAGPGFINFRLVRQAWLEELRHVLAEGEEYGRSHLGQGKRVQVEFVSANPTGPLHVGHGRSAAYGDVLANLLAFSGYQVEREYYINDAGAQMAMLGRSTFLRYCELLEQEIDFPENGYRGEYVRALAEELKTKYGLRLLELEEEQAQAICRREAGDAILQGIRQDLENFGVRFDTWFSEQSLFESAAVETALEKLKENGNLYEKDGAWWLRSSAYGDDEDRVVVRADGRPTYLASDIAYHQHKFARAYDLIIDLWGADHHGYIPRVRAAVQALGYAPDPLKILLVQFVNLVRGDQRVSMSTRAGAFVTLAEVVDEVGRDAARFFYLLRRGDAHLDFDLELAKQQSAENPVYYVQYAHARIASIYDKARETGSRRLPLREVDFSCLQQPLEIKLMKRLAAFPGVVESAAATLEPHRLTFYIIDLVGDFHRYYNSHRVLDGDPQLASARLYLLEAIRCVVARVLQLLGVSAPTSM
ncbi:MAG: arginine--tRNA ligase [Candidatus Tectomicrobia bacterium]|nr:arginine--tRNA ligase [Candidatus Tectomicrobia bacterium]